MAARSAFLDDRVAAYVDSTVRRNSILDRLREETSHDPRANMQIGADQGQFMQLLVKALGVRRYLEIGVFTGYSSLAVALALPPDGKVVACDISDEWTSIGRKYWREAAVESRIDLRLAPALETLDGLIRDGASGRSTWRSSMPTKPRRRLLRALPHVVSLRRRDFGRQRTVGRRRRQPSIADAETVRVTCDQRKARRGRRARRRGAADRRRRHLDGPQALRQHARSRHRRRSRRALLLDPREAAVSGVATCASSNATARSTPSAGASSSRMRRWTNLRDGRRADAARDHPVVRALGRHRDPLQRRRRSSRAATASAASRASGLLQILQERAREARRRAAVSSRTSRTSKPYARLRSARREPTESTAACATTYAARVRAEASIGGFAASCGSARRCRSMRSRSFSSRPNTDGLPCTPIASTTTMSTFIVECREETWLAHGLDAADTEADASRSANDCSRRTCTAIS